MVNVASLQRMPAKTLSELILAEAGTEDKSYAIIDVRDHDHLGGHIKTSTHVPSATLEAFLPTLLRTLAPKRTVIFHCALSQQRGPSAALRYLREREKKAGGPAAETAEIPAEQQAVYVLDLGFVGWAREYGSDERLTENFRKELWEDY
ncbi:related to Putative protein-tyrosin-phosphatase [Cephalotrichum gorgonifer]|uniref:Rhodanese domain-containing protein n=1 Tax=Cephalotrichum gorgonifer TaxID=2041049 RepID=A0AAE8SSB5_9PEZI|nr:related to Putative protein-tyrosin-phosphatase [Cephalotrichum gorgonifer]